MMGSWYDHNTLYTELHMREMRAVAEEARRARQARRPRRLRRRVGEMLVTAGEILVR